MLEHIFQSSRHLSQLRQAPFAATIDALADKFYRLGYAKRGSSGFSVGHFIPFIILKGPFYALFHP